MPNNWFALDVHIQDGRNPNYRKLANNTVAIRRDDGIAVQLHKTDVLTFHSDRETVTYDTGGWLTVTTKDRFNTFGPNGWSVWADKGIWHLHGPTDDPLRYFDGIRVHILNQTVENATDGPNFDSMDRSNGQMRKLIAGYVKGLTGETVTGLLAQDGRGDCLYCQMGGDVFDTEHLTSHLRENYYMPNLLLNAYRARGYIDPQLVLTLDGTGNAKRVRETVGKYLRAQLLENIATR